MNPYVKETGRVAPLLRADVDTDQIIPAAALKRVERTGFGAFLFHGLRTGPDGRPEPTFVLNDPRYDGARVLVTGRNFGCGSSREHAVWALEDYGFRTIIAPSFADIFRSNCLRNGLLPLELDEDVIDTIAARARDDGHYVVTVDLEALVVTDNRGLQVPFSIDPFRRRCLLNAWDDIELTLQHEEAILMYEKRRGIGA